MKIGDIVHCNYGFHWIIFEMSDCKNYLYLIGLENHLKSAYLGKNEIMTWESKPENTEWIYLKRRAKNLAGLENYF